MIIITVIVIFIIIIIIDTEGFDVAKIIGFSNIFFPGP